MEQVTLCISAHRAIKPLQQSQHNSIRWAWIQMLLCSHNRTFHKGSLLLSMRRLKVTRLRSQLNISNLGFNHTQLSRSQAIRWLRLNSRRRGSLSNTISKPTLSTTNSTINSWCSSSNTREVARTSMLLVRVVEMGITTRSDVIKEWKRKGKFGKPLTITHSHFVYVMRISASQCL